MTTKKIIRVSPSSYSRWGVCPTSVFRGLQVPKLANDNLAYKELADRGTLIHNLLEQFWLVARTKKLSDAYKVLSFDYFRKKKLAISKEQAEHMSQAVSVIIEDFSEVLEKPFGLGSVVGKSVDIRPEASFLTKYSVKGSKGVYTVEVKGRSDLEAVVREPKTNRPHLFLYDYKTTKVYNIYDDAQIAVRALGRWYEQILNGEEGLYYTRTHGTFINVFYDDPLLKSHRIYDPKFLEAWYRHKNEDGVSFSSQLEAIVKSFEEPIAGVTGSKQCRFCPVFLRCPDVKESVKKELTVEIQTKDKI